VLAALSHRLQVLFHDIDGVVDLLSRKCISNLQSKGILVAEVERSSMRAWCGLAV